MIIIVLTIHVIAINQDYYYSIPVFDILMHFFGGFAITLLAMAVYGWLAKRIAIKTKKHPQSALSTMLFKAIFVIGFVMIVSVAWELYEFLSDQFLTDVVEKYGAAQMGITDTMNDFVNDFLGAVVAFIAFNSLM